MSLVYVTVCTGGVIIMQGFLSGGDCPGVIVWGDCLLSRGLLSRWVIVRGDCPVAVGNMSDHATCISSK